MKNTHKEITLAVVGLVFGLIIGASSHLKEQILTAGSCIREGIRKECGQSFKHRRYEVLTSVN